MSYLRGPVTLAEMKPLTEAAGPDVRPASAPEPRRDAYRSAPPVMSAEIEQLFAVGSPGPAAPELLVKGRVTVERKTLGLYRTQDEVWRIPVADDGDMEWEQAELIDTAPEVAVEAPEGMTFPSSAPALLDARVKKADQLFVAWRARQPVLVWANPKLKMSSEAGESREQFLERCLVRADRADDAEQERARRRFGKRMETLERRVSRERDELERDQQQLKTRKAEEVLGVVEGLFSVLLGSRSVRTAGGKAASRMRTAAGKRRMSQRAAASVVESEREIERIEEELEDLAVEMQDEVDRIALASERKAEMIEEAAIRPKRADVEIRELVLLWR
jgi:hypothetical protein